MNFQGGMIQYPKAEQMIKTLSGKEKEICDYLEANPGLDPSTVIKLKIRLTNIRDLIRELRKRPEDSAHIEYFRFD